MLRRDGWQTGAPRTVSLPVLGAALVVALLSSLLAVAGCGGGDADGGSTGGDAVGNGDAVTFDVPPRDITPQDGRTFDVLPVPDADAAEDIPGPPPDEVDPVCVDFLGTCEFNPDCCDGWCVIGPDGIQRVCSKTCVSAACPEGWGCTQIGTPPDVQFVCLPRRPPTCFQPCRSDAECTADNRCLPIGAGKFCSRRCDDGTGNPNDAVCASENGEYVCSAATDPEGGGADLGFHCQPISGSCVCGPEINLMADTNNCGSCGRVCGFEHATAECNGGECEQAACDPGWVDLNENWEDGCEYECTFLDADDLPDAQGVDANCDGIDGVVARSVFVAPSGADEGNTLGDREHPFRSIGAAIRFANGPGTRKDVLVSIGTYEEQVQVASGVNLYGGYSRAEGWKRNVADNTTYVVWNSVENGAIRTVLVLGGTVATVVDGFTIRSGNNPVPGGSSYAVYITHVGKEFVLSNCRIEAGSGADGRPGTDGEPGQDGVAGGRGEDGKSDYCNPDFYVFGGTAGTRQCGGWNASGGDGGYAGYGKSSGWFCEGRPNGEAGDGSPAGADGGGGGGYEDDGAPGEDGLPGTPGADGAGGAATGQVDTFGLWQPAPGLDGTAGSHGQGGGGGGGGGGRESTILFIETGTYHGGGGGAGGAGGCGGTAGTGGGGGGASFAVFVLQASPTLLDNVIIHGRGGDGGAGGRRGTGGRSGPAGAGGSGTEGSGSGASGGIGGAGGNGGHGGGGAGGPAFGVYLVQANATICEDNQFQSGGSGGTGGAGGDPFEAAQKGDDGPWGALNAPTATCSEQ